VLALTGFALTPPALAKKKKKTPPTPTGIIHSTRLFVEGSNPIDTTNFTGLSLQFSAGPGEGAIMSSFNDGASVLTFYTKDGPGQPITQRMIIDTNGNVGIGTDSPAQALDVVGNGGFSGSLTAASATISGNGDVRLNGGDFRPLGTGADGVRWVDGSGSIQAHIHRFGAVDNRLYFTNNGAGNLTGVFLASGATSLTSTSDERLKYDIEPITGILDKIKDIRVVGFNMATLSADPATEKINIDRNPPPRTTRDGTVIKHQIGTMAQDWIANFPELVVEPQADDQYYGLAYERIGVVALGAVKELSKIVSQKDAEIARLTAELAALKARDQAHEARLTRLEKDRDNRPARAVNAVLAVK
jgi:uncharacterized small protein (DUF1192 family)